MTDPRITIIGGGSAHWTPRLITDFLNTPSLAQSTVALYDLDPEAPRRMAALGTALAERRGGAMTVVADDDRGRALAGSDAVITTFSVGGLDALGLDIDIPARYGIRQPIGDSVGPGGVSRSLRAVPVILEMARAVEEHCPDAWFVNVSNPLSVLTRAVTTQTGLRTVSLCNELVALQFMMSLLFDVRIEEVDFVVGGVNHFPIVTELRLGDERSGLDRLREAVESGPPPGPLWMQPPPAMHWRKVSEGAEFTKVDVLANLSIKLELFTRFGVLPGANDHHIVEFMPGFVHPDNGHGESWHVHHFGIAGHRDESRQDVAHIAGLLAAPDVPRLPSGELVARLLDGLISGQPRHLPMNLPNAGQVTSLPDGVIVECMGVADAAGVRPRDVTAVPGIIGEYVRRIVTCHELTLDAALSGEFDPVLAAMLADPLAGRLPYEQVIELTRDLVVAHARWLPPELVSQVG